MDVFSQFLKELGPARVVTTGITILFFIAFIIFYLFKVSNQDLVTLYSDLDLEDSTQIQRELESKGIRYEIAAGGTIIKVPEDKVLKLRMTMAELGIPAKGSIVGYEVFDGGESISTSNFLQNVNLVRALEGELTRTIATFEQIDNARVHLAMPKKELFSREKLEPRASVVLKMKGNKVLRRAEINAIAHLIVTSVPSLELHQITIVDTKGRPLKLGSSDENDPNVLATQSEDFRTAYENRLKRTIEDLLEGTVGVGKVKAYVSADMNFDRIVTNSETFDPEGKVARSIQTTEERESSSQGGASADASAANNLPGANSDPAASKNVNNTERIDEVTNFEISKTVKNHISETGNVKRISVAVMVDGIYKNDPANLTMTYVPRTEEEMKKYELLIKSAIGFRDDRDDKLEVINMQFLTDLDITDKEQPFDWLKSELPNMVQTSVIALVIILILVTVIRPIAMKAFEVSKEDFNVKPAGDHLSLVTDSVKGDDQQSAIDNLKEAMLDVDKHPDDKYRGNQSLKKLNEVVASNPQDTAILLRKWLNEDS